MLVLSVKVVGLAVLVASVLSMPKTAKFVVVKVKPRVEILIAKQRPTSEANVLERFAYKTTECNFDLKKGKRLGLKSIH